MNYLWAIACGICNVQAIAIISGAIISGLMLGFSYRLIKANMPQRVKCFFGFHSVTPWSHVNIKNKTITHSCFYCKKIYVKHIKLWKMKDDNLFYALILSLPVWAIIIATIFFFFGCSPTYRIPADQYLYVGGLPAAVKNIQEANGHDSCMVVGFTRKGVAIVKCVKVREK